MVAHISVVGLPGRFSKAVPGGSPQEAIDGVFFFSRGNTFHKFTFDCSLWGLLFLLLLMAASTARWDGFCVSRPSARLLLAFARLRLGCCCLGLYIQRETGSGFGPELSSPVDGALSQNSQSWFLFLLCGISCCPDIFSPAAQR